MSGGAHLGAAFALAACLAGLALEAEPLNIS
jgi:hypothetical protein